MSHLLDLLWNQCAKTTWGATRDRCDRCMLAKQDPTHVFYGCIWGWWKSEKDSEHWVFAGFFEIDYFVKSRHSWKEIPCPNHHFSIHMKKSGCECPLEWWKWKMKSVVEETDRLGETRFPPPWVFDPHSWKICQSKFNWNRHLTDVTSRIWLGYLKTPRKTLLHFTPFRVSVPTTSNALVTLAI